MNKKNRLIAMFMALAMVLAFMPAMAFAEDGDTAEFSEAPAEALAPAGEEAVASEARNEGEIIAGLLRYTLKADGTMDLYYYDEGAQALTSVTIPANVILDGVYHPVTSIDFEALYGLNNLTSVTVPQSVTVIGEKALGYYSDPNTGADAKVPGFTIFGITGSAAQAYANANGFLFRDPDAEALAAAEAARQGTRVGNIPKVKVSKPKAGKKSITVKWKKLSKKKVKKTKVTHYEVWVCANTGFAMGQTSEHMIKKSKTGVKITKVPKGTYYVKARAVRKVGEMKYVGPWSKVKKVKVKK